MSPRYFLDAYISRPTVGAGGDLVSGTETLVRASVWDHKLKTVLGGVGELFSTTAAGFFPLLTDIQRRDRVRLTDGRQYEVVRVIPGVNDRGVQNHIGVQLIDAD